MTWPQFRNVMVPLTIWSRAKWSKSSLHGSAKWNSLCHAQLSHCVISSKWPLEKKRKSGKKIYYLSRGRVCKCLNIFATASDDIRHTIKVRKIILAKLGQPILVADCSPVKMRSCCQNCKMWLHSEICDLTTAQPGTRPRSLSELWAFNKCNIVNKSSNTPTNGLT